MKHINKDVENELVGKNRRKKNGDIVFSYLIVNR